tara:strand:- start:1693 stop:2796 length:1104 start_codon:yes stop_codon:yes gene_type:complete
MINNNDTKYMLIAIEQAKKGMYRTHPNPMVGAVIVKNSKIISKGYHKQFRDKHAEQDAIDKAKESLKGAVLYVTLEPCYHHGNTPPCVDSIIKNKFSRVVIGAKDPNPLVNEKSISKLKENSIIVTTGVCEKEAIELNKSFFYKYLFNKPYIRLKFGTSLDGKIATQKKESKWITSEESRKYVQKIRAEVNAILTTSNTILHDNPFMNIRDSKIIKSHAKQPSLIILDTKLRIPQNANIFKTERLIILITDVMNASRNSLKLYNKNVVIKYVSSKNDKILLNDIYQIAKIYGLDDILVECGNKFSKSLFDQNAVDELLYFVAPKILGNKSLNFSGITPINSLKDKISLRINKIKKIENDLFIDMRRI